MNNKISIIIPIYNQEENLIKKCISSLTNQTYKNLEILMIDDGSKQSYKKTYIEIAKKDNRIKLFHKENTGVSDTRNYGIDKSNGQYITFVDSDDWIEKNAIEIMIKNLEKRKTDIVRTTYYITDGTKSTPKYYNIKTGLYNKEKIKETLIPSLINGIENNFVPLLMIKKEIVEKIKFDNDIGMLEDECFFIKLLLNINSIYLLDIPTYYYYQNNMSKTKSSKHYENNIYDIIKVNQKLNKMLKENKLETLINDLNKSHSLIILRYLNLIYIAKKNSIIVFKQITKEINNKKILSNYHEFKIPIHLKIQLYLAKKQRYYLLMLIFKIKKILKKQI